MIPTATGITGALQGIGASLVGGLYKHDHIVVADSRSIQSSDVGKDAAILSVAGDIAGPEVARRVIDQALKRFGGLNTPVSNVGVVIPKPFVDYAKADSNRREPDRVLNANTVVTRGLYIGALLEEFRSLKLLARLQTIQLLSIALPAMLTALRRADLTGAICSTMQFRQ